MGRRCSACFLKHTGRSCLPLPFGSERLPRDRTVRRRCAASASGAGRVRPPLLGFVFWFSATGAQRGAHGKVGQPWSWPASPPPRPRADAADASRSMLGDSPSSRSSGKIWCLRTSAQNYHRPTSVPGEAGSAWCGGPPLLAESPARSSALSPSPRHSCSSRSSPGTYVFTPTQSPRVGLTSLHGDATRDWTLKIDG